MQGGWYWLDRIYAECSWRWICHAFWMAVVFCSSIGQKILTRSRENRLLGTKYELNVSIPSRVPYWVQQVIPLGMRWRKLVGPCFSYWARVSSRKPKIMIENLYFVLACLENTAGKPVPEARRVLNYSRFLQKTSIGCLFVFAFSLSFRYFCAFQFPSD